MNQSPGSQSGPTSPEAPWSVRTLNGKVKGWIERLGSVWVEGQITQLNAKPSWKMAYVTLRDLQAEMSIQLTCPISVLQSMQAEPKEGDRVIVLGRPTFYTGRGQFSLHVVQMRPVGIGELLARIEQLRKLMAAEGLFALERKKPLPFLPHRIGLITGRGSAAERDVLAVSQDRWPAVNFRIINTAVQGARAVPEIIDALQVLDRDPEVEVIIVARGGGSAEDLLPFSDEALVRAVAKVSTPLVSAIGHEPDHPLLDDIADLRAATPTDAAKRVVADVSQELAGIEDSRLRIRAAMLGWIDRQLDGLRQLRERPVLADPMTPIRSQEEEIQRSQAQIRRMIAHHLDRSSSEIAALRGKVSALGPAATLSRGYSIVQVIPRDGSDPEVVTTIEQAPPGSQLRVRLADGSITAAAMSVRPSD